MMVIWLVWANFPDATAQPVNLFALPNDDPVVRVLVTVGPELPTIPEGVPSPAPMLLQAMGILKIVEGRDVSLLVKSGLRTNEAIDRPDDAVTLYYFHLFGEKDTRRTLEIMRTSEGRWLAEEGVGTLAVIPRRMRLDPVRFSRLAQTWSSYRGRFEVDQEIDGGAGGANSDPVARVFELGKPYVSGWPFMDERALRSRTYIAPRSEKIGTTRELSEEALRIRLPRGYSPNNPPGLVVWVHAAAGGSPPASFDKALDELNLICVGADNSGNARAVADRYQLALDGVATVSARYHIDRRRIYVTGISGGGRISSMLFATAPEVFTGAIPIVGVNFYKKIPTGDGRFWPATYKRPPPVLLRLMKQHRIAVMTGPPDFNYKPSVATVQEMRREHIDAKLFEYPDMGHEMPTEDRFFEAIKWVDDPYQEVRAKEEAEARKWLDRYHEQNGSDRPSAGPQRELLNRVMESGPWSKSGWEAYRLLTRRM